MIPTPSYWNLYMYVPCLILSCFIFIYSCILIPLLQEYENKKDKTDEDVTTAAEAITANLTNAQNVMGIVNRLLTPNRRGRILLFMYSSKVSCTGGL